MNKFVVALIASIAGIVGGASVAAEEARDWAEIIPPDVAQADFAALYDGLKSAHVNLFENRTPEEYDARYVEALAGLSAPISRFDLLLIYQQFTAYGNVAHARIDFPSEVYDRYRAQGGKTFPLYLRIVEGRAFVSQNYSRQGTIVRGDEILSIDGVPMAVWLERTGAYVSADTDYIAHSLLEFLFSMYLWADIGERDAFDVRLRDEGGRIKAVRVPGATRAEIDAAVQDAPNAFALDFNGREAKMVTDHTAYLRPGPFYNVEDPNRIWDNSTMVAFIDQAFEDFASSNAASLVIDLRDNPGGDNSFSDPMIAWIADREFRFASKFLIRSSDEAAASNQARLDANPGAVEGVSGQFAKAYEATPRGELFEFDIPFAAPREQGRFVGDVYVMVNRHSYSNAVNVASIFQDYGWGKIVGEKTTDMATTYGAMEHFELPKTGIKVGFPKAHIIRPSGDTTIDGVTPDLPIESPIVAGAEDAVLSRLIAHIEQR